MKNTKIRMIATLGICAALSVALISMIHFPVFPAVGFLEYDPADIPIFICTFLFGPVSGIILTVIASTIQGITVSSGSNWIGIIMHIFATGSYVIAAGMIYKKGGSLKRLTVACAAGILTWTAVMVVWNLIFTPIFMHAPFSAVVDLMPWIILFNLLKASVNSVGAVLVYKAVSKIIKK